MSRSWKLTPSMLTFGLECPACFRAEMYGTFKKPYTPFPTIFGRIDKAMRGYWNDRSACELDPSLPPGKVLTEDLRVQSTSIVIPGHTDTCYISGKIDALINFGTEGYGIVDFKTTEIAIEKLQRYRIQTHAYAWALEHPAFDKFPLRSPVSRMGLLVYQPTCMADETTLSFDRGWVEMERDDQWFLNTLAGVMDLLTLPDELVQGKEGCQWCHLRRQIGA